NGRSRKLNIARQDTRILCSLGYAQPRFLACEEERRLMNLAIAWEIVATDGDKRSIIAAVVSGFGIVDNLIIVVLVRCQRVHFSKEGRVVLKLRPFSLRKVQVDGFQVPGAVMTGQTCGVHSQKEPGS